MSSRTDLIKTLASRFVSLPVYLRLEVVKKLLVSYDEDQDWQRSELHKVAASEQRRKSFIEQFWDEVEKAHGSGLHFGNPFTEQRLKRSFEASFSAESKLLLG